MSASERLKALDGFAWNANVTDLQTGADIVRNALPELIALVAAAEQTYMTKDIHEALAALEAKLANE